MIRFLLIFFILFFTGCKEWSSICHDIIIPDCDYKKTPKKCKELEQKECDRWMRGHIGK